MQEVAAAAIKRTSAADRRNPNEQVVAGVLASMAVVGFNGTDSHAAGTCGKIAIFFRTFRFLGPSLSRMACRGELS
jgi:hypothetical protein